MRFQLWVFLIILKSLILILSNIHIVMIFSNRIIASRLNNCCCDFLLIINPIHFFLSLSPGCIIHDLLSVRIQPNIRRLFISAYKIGRIHNRIIPIFFSLLDVLAILNSFFHAINLSLMFQCLKTVMKGCSVAFYYSRPELFYLTSFCNNTSRLT